MDVGFLSNLFLTEKGRARENRIFPQKLCDLEENYKLILLFNSSKSIYTHT